MYVQSLVFRNIWEYTPGGSLYFATIHGSIKTNDFLEISRSFPDLIFPDILTLTLTLPTCQAPRGRKTGRAPGEPISAASSTMQEQLERYLEIDGENSATKKVES